MARFFNLPVNTEVYFADTKHLTCEQHGAYQQLLLLTWRSRGCAIDLSDDLRIARMISTSPRRWRAMKPVIMAFFDRGADGLWRQKRLTATYEDVLAKVERRREAAKKGGRRHKRTPNGDEKRELVDTPAKQTDEAKSLKSNDVALAKDSQCFSSQSQSQTTPTESNLSSCVVPSGSWPDGALEQFLSVYPEHTKLEGAYGLKRQWINLQAALASRYAWETVMAGVRDYVANKPDHQPWMKPITFIQEERFMDRRAAKPVKPARAPKPDRSKNGFGALRSKTHQRGSEQSGAAPDDNQPGEEGYRSPFDDGSCIEGEAVEIPQQAGPPAHGPVHHRKP